MAESPPPPGANEGERPKDESKDQPVPTSSTGPDGEPTRRFERPSDHPGRSEPTRPIASAPAPARPAPAPHPRPRPRPFPLGRVVLGALLLAGGILWLLGVLDVVDISVRAVLSLSLIAVGIGLLIGARTGGHTGLIFLGIVLTALLTLISSFNIRIEGGVGERTERPATVQQLKSEYRLGVGQLTVDLTDLRLQSGTTRVHAVVGMGRLVVKVPDRVAVRVRGTAGTGQVTLFGREENGFDVDVLARRGNQFAAETGARLELEVEVGIGQVDVRVGEAAR